MRCLSSWRACLCFLCALCDISGIANGQERATARAFDIRLAEFNLYEDTFIAIKNDQVGKVQRFLNKGIDPNSRDTDGYPLLMLAAHHQAWRTFELLLNHPEIRVNARNAASETALMLVARHDQLAFAQRLIALGAEVNQPDWTALHYAATFGHNDLVRLMLEHSAYIDAESPNKTTPLMMAAQGGHVETVKLLLEEGADASLKNDKAWTATDFAEQYGHHALAEALKKRQMRQGHQ